MNSLKDKLKAIPHKPGVYKFLDKAGTVIYVGKAKDLRSRVAQYFGAGDSRSQLPFLMNDAADFDYTVVNSELDSLFLENTLIKQYLPAYNIRLRDDKNYAFIKIDYSTQIPQIDYARQIGDSEESSFRPNPERAKRVEGEVEGSLKQRTRDSSTSLGMTKKTKYFGPYSSTKKIKDTLDFTRRIFPYCAAKKVSSRPCFYYHLHRCPGVCIGAVSLADYQKQIGRIELFLSGKTAEVKKDLKHNMKAAAKKRRFELAARLRNQLHAIEVLDEKQVAIFPQNVNWDFVSVYSEGSNACINLFKVRTGRLIDKENFLYQIIYNNPLAERETLQRFAETYYAETTNLPKEIFFQIAPPGEVLLVNLLRSRTKNKIKLSMPSRGKKLQLSNLGITNAKAYLTKWQNSQADSLNAIRAALEQLKALLKLPAVPRRIEGYDISNIQGTNPTGSMVVVKDGLPAKAEYRKFKINVKQTPDDFAMMREILDRRLARLQSPDAAKWPKPDLIVVDGGKGQLGVAVALLKKLHLAIPIIGLAKRIEEIFLAPTVASGVPHNFRSIILSHDNSALQLLQRLRDEAHRFGITFHRSLRSKAAVKSALDEIPGIGPKTKKLLKEKIGTVAQMRQTSLANLTKLIGKEKALLLKKSL